MRSATSPTLPLGLILGTTALVAVSPAKSETLTVMAEVQSSCSIVADVVLDFGIYDNVTTNATTQIQITCGGQSRMVNISLDGGLYHSASRRMRNDEDTGSFLPYTLYDNDPALGGTVWAPDTSRSVPVDGVSNGAITVGGQIGLGLGGSPGSYTDTVQITLSLQ